jgi:hypothetical protein
VLVSRTWVWWVTFGGIWKRTKRIWRRRQAGRRAGVYAKQDAGVVLGRALRPGEWGPGSLLEDWNSYASKSSVPGVGRDLESAVPESFAPLLKSASETFSGAFTTWVTSSS